MEGAQIDIGEGVRSPLKFGCDRSWASLEPQLTYMYIPGVQSVESMGSESVTRGNQMQELMKEMSYHCLELKLLTERDINVMTQNSLIS